MTPSNKITCDTCVLTEYARCVRCLDKSNWIPKPAFVKSAPAERATQAIDQLTTRPVEQEATHTDCVGCRWSINGKLDPGTLKCDSCFDNCQKGSVERKNWTPKLTPVQVEPRTCGNCGEQGIGPLKKNQNCRPCHVYHDYRNWKPLPKTTDCTKCGKEPKDNCFVAQILPCENFIPKQPVPVCSICGMIGCRLSVSDHLRFDEERKLRDTNKQPVDNAKLDAVISRCKNHIPYPLEVGEQPLTLDKVCQTCGGDPAQHDMMCDGVEQPATTKTCGNCYIKCYNFKYRKQGEDCCEHWAPEPSPEDMAIAQDSELKTVTLEDVQAILEDRELVNKIFECWVESQDMRGAINAYRTIALDKIKVTIK